jgi:hypothetical protein
MRLMIIHDSSGNVRGLVASPPDGLLAYPQTEPGELVTQVDAPDIRVDLTPQQINDRLADRKRSQGVKFISH